MFPLSDSEKSGKIPFVTLALIAINCFVFFNQLTISSPDLFIHQFALTPNLVSVQTFYTFITALFLHGGFFHIAANMWFLWIFGDNVEAKLGKVKFILLYFLAGLAGNVLQYAIHPSSSIPILGASGAISGIIGAYIILLPLAKIKTIFIFLFSFSVVQVPVVIYIAYWFVLQLFSGIASLPFSFQSGGIAFWAHIGGFMAGVWYIRKFGRNKQKQDFIEGELVD